MLQQELLLLEEVAGYLRVSVKTVRRLTAARELPSLRIRGRILVKRTDLKAFVGRCAA